MWTCKFFNGLFLQERLELLSFSPKKIIIETEPWQVWLKHCQESLFNQKILLVWLQEQILTWNEK